ncbi:alpha/beta hydrolase family protein [Sporosarcina sp. NPDC096371]|uniref:alpha/beta hydrolase family protein n=1 Tax=Sporosarcina sp. NPDC096371 TaxID=3364530 RepID=UPI003814AF7A
MRKEKASRFSYNLFDSPPNSENETTVIFYHGWGTNADSYNDVAKDIAKEGYSVIVPEIIYHDTRKPLKNHFEKETMQNYFWKTIVESINEFDEFVDGLGLSKHKIVLVGSSMGGFIANGIFASQNKLGGLVNINGSGSFLLSERQFRERDNRVDLPIGEELILNKFDPVGRENCHAPVLLLHGDSDKIVPIEGQKNYFKYLTEIEGSKNVELLIYKNVNHQFTEEMLKDLIGWLNHLGK